MALAPVIGQVDHETMGEGEGVGGAYVGGGQEVIQYRRLVPIERSESLRLLAHARFGRVVLNIDGLPAALPVNLAVVDGDVIFATAPGLKLQAARAGEVVSIETDEIDRLYHLGWSVLVTGEAHEITDPQELDSLRHLDLQPWAPGAHPHLVRVRSQIVSGRRITPGVLNTATVDPAPQDSLFEP
ncbi:MAG: pyridoxamine 5'-phosphate oxidase family protein [Actinobacteria bacterium]|nr:pyridoxamine 5'-phosphate oxidase family protein [Actinomycetota bacterium]